MREIKNTNRDIVVFRSYIIDSFQFIKSIDKNNFYSNSNATIYYRRIDDTNYLLFVCFKNIECYVIDFLSIEFNNKVSINNFTDVKPLRTKTIKLHFDFKKDQNILNEFYTIN